MTIRGIGDNITRKGDIKSFSNRKVRKMIGMDDRRVLGKHWKENEDEAVYHTLSPLSY